MEKPDRLMYLLKKKKPAKKEGPSASIVGVRRDGLRWISFAGFLFRSTTCILTVCKYAFACCLSQGDSHELQWDLLDALCMQEEDSPTIPAHTPVSPPTHSLVGSHAFTAVCYHFMYAHICIHAFRHALKQAGGFPVNVCITISVVSVQTNIKFILREYCINI